MTITAIDPKHDRRTNSVGQAAKPYDCNFIEPGLVSYRDIGIVLVQRPALDKMAQSFRGKPIFNENHKNVSERDFTDNLDDGLVTGVYFDPKDGWYHAEFFAKNEDTIRNCDGGYSVSCAYDVTKWGPGGVHHNIPYQAEVLDGVYTHLAIVSNPRYEAARIITNSQGGNMKLMFWKKNDETKQAIELENAAVAVGEKEVPVSEMVALYNAVEKDKAEKAKRALLNDDDTIEVEGKKVSVKDLKSTYAASLANAKNDDDEDDDDEKKKKKKDVENADGDCPKCDGSGKFDGKECPACEGTGKKKSENSRKNADTRKDDEDGESDDDMKKEKERKNSESFRELKNAAANRPMTFTTPQILTLSEKEAEGYKRYGPKA